MQRNADLSEKVATALFPPLSFTDLCFGVNVTCQLPSTKRSERSTMTSLWVHFCFAITLLVLMMVLSGVMASAAAVVVVVVAACVCVCVFPCVFPLSSGMQRRCRFYHHFR